MFKINKKTVSIITVYFGVSGFGRRLEGTFIIAAIY